MGNSDCDKKERCVRPKRFWMGVGYGRGTEFVTNLATLSRPTVGNKVHFRLQRISRSTLLAPIGFINVLLTYCTDWWNGQIR